MQDGDADSMLVKTLGKANENPTIWISCTTETFGFSHLRQVESNIPLTQELCWQKYFQTHLQWNRTSWIDRDRNSLPMNCLVILRGLWTEHLLSIFESLTHTLIFPYKPAPPNTLCIDSACSITPMQDSAKQRIKKCALYWKEMKEIKEKIVVHSFIRTTLFCPRKIQIQNLT